MMGILILGFVVVSRNDDTDSTSVDAGVDEQVAGADERSDLQLNELARGAVAGIGVGEQTPASAVASQVDEETTLVPAAPVVSELPAAEATTTEAPTTTAKPVTTKPPTTKPATTKPPTTEAPATTVTPTDPTAPVDPTASTDPAAPTDPTATPPPPPAETHPEGYVDAGHGVWIPAVMVAIRHCESHDNYTAVNASSGAAGAYQFLNSSWASYGFAAKYGVKSAKLATPAQQDEAALAAYIRSGTNPWKASKSCWG